MLISIIIRYLNTKKYCSLPPRGGFLVGYPIPRKKNPHSRKISIPKKSPKNPQSPDFQKSPIFGDKNPKILKIPNPHPQDLGFLRILIGNFLGIFQPKRSQIPIPGIGDFFTGDFWGSRISDPHPWDFKFPGIF